MNQICDFKRSSDSKEQEIFAIPDFVGLIYPVISMKDDVTHPGSRKQLLGDNSTSENIIQYSADLNVTSCFPPVFYSIVVMMILCQLKTVCSCTVA